MLSVFGLKHMGDLFETTYIYRCILTNDNDLTAKEVIEFYNQRGRAKRTSTFRTTTSAGRGCSSGR